MGVSHLMDGPLADDLKFSYLTPYYGTERRLALK
jgi:hypothetical protein